tara:strand:- start:5768 stop:5950 length:183 start_codon:yes stop_codon:yes gene_type:complete
MAIDAYHFSPKPIISVHAYTPKPAKAQSIPITVSAFNSNPPRAMNITAIRPETISKMRLG